MTTTDVTSAPTSTPVPSGAGPRPGDATDPESPYTHGVQVVDEEKKFNEGLATYLTNENVTPAGFNYHLISVFGSQSTGKSTLLNCLFGTKFNVMRETERRQTTKGIWLSKDQHQRPSQQQSLQNGSAESSSAPTTPAMAENILVMDVEGTDGRERGEDQDFERKSALFALATSEVLIVNIWEHQVGLYQGANMGLLKTVFEVNLQLFLKDKKSTPRSLLLFVIRDYIGTTPLDSLKTTLLQDLTRIWDSLSKPAGLENSSIGDYFDFEFAGLPHKNFQPDKFTADVHQLGLRFREGRKEDKDTSASDRGLFLPEYHRRIPADGFAVYAQGIWDQIESNKDLDLPTQQELLAQFRCDEISRQSLVAFDKTILPLEEEQEQAKQQGKPTVITGLGKLLYESRAKTLSSFDSDAGRYHKRVYQAKKTELEEKIDGRLKALFAGQLNAIHVSGIQDFSEAVSAAVRSGQKQGSYDFAAIVASEQKTALDRFKTIAGETAVEGAPWSDYEQPLRLYEKELGKISAQLRRDEMRRLTMRVERWVKSRVSENMDLLFNELVSGRETTAAATSSAAGEAMSKPSEFTIWDRVWSSFLVIVGDAEKRFSERAASFSASSDEVEVGVWRLKRRSWGLLHAKLDEILMEGNLLLKLRENFDDKFRYDDRGVPRVWRPTDDIEGAYKAARESTLTLIPLLARFRLAETSEPPPLDEWIGRTPAAATAADEEDLHPIGGVDEEEGQQSLEEETTLLSETKRQDLTARFRKAADGVYVEAKRGAIGGITQVPLYFYGLLLALGWNEILAVLRNPLYVFMVLIVGAAAYVTFHLNLWGPLIKMANAASEQAIRDGKRRLRDFLSEDGNTGGSSGGGGRSPAMATGEEYEMTSFSRASMSPRPSSSGAGAGGGDEY